MGRGLSDAKAFMGRAYNFGAKFASTVDRHAGLIRRVVGAVAAMAGALTGPVGQAVGTGIGVAMRGAERLRRAEDPSHGPDGAGGAGGAGNEKGLKEFK